MRALQRLLVVAFVAVALVVTVAPSAGALTLSPTDWQSRLVSVAPATDAVRVEVFEGGEAIRVVVAPGHTVVVPGYANEPYLRVGADGTVEENRNSPTWWSNRSKTGDAPVPADLPSTPDWVRIGGDGALTWHDHRIHAMPGVTGDTDWTVTFAVDDLPVGARGRLTKLPSHTPALEMLTAMVVGGAVWILGRRRPRSTTGGAVLTASLLATALAIGEASATPPGMEVPALHLVVAVAAAILAVAGIALWRVRAGIGTVVVVGSLAMTAWWWALMLPVLTAAIVPNSFADPIVRSGLAVVAGLLLAGAALLVRSGGLADAGQAGIEAAGSGAGTGAGAGAGAVGVAE